MQALNLIKNPRLGCDPELFVETDESKIIPATGLVGGTKDNPRPLAPGFFIQEDNVMVEFNIPPASNKEEFKNAVVNGLRLVSSVLPDTTRYKIKPSHLFTMDQLNQPASAIFGCDPDYDAWTNSINQKLGDPGSLRSCGGHIHVGYDNSRISLNIEIVKAMDLFLGVPSILMDTDKFRRKLYGKAGCFRHKVYGVEYRTLSSFWLGSEQLIDWAWEQSMRAVDFINSGERINDELGAKIIQIINYGLEAKAFDLSAKFNLTVA